MKEHAVHQKCVHVLQDGLVTIVNKVRRDVAMSDIYLMIILKTSMNVMVIMSVIKSVLTLMDLLCAHVMMDICYKLMEELVQVCIFCIYTIMYSLIHSCICHHSVKHFIYRTIQYIGIMKAWGFWPEIITPKPA